MAGYFRHKFTKVLNLLTVHRQIHINLKGKKKDSLFFARYTYSSRLFYPIKRNNNREQVSRCPYPHLSFSGISLSNLGRKNSLPLYLSFLESISRLDSICPHKKHKKKVSLSLSFPSRVSQSLTQLSISHIFISYHQSKDYSLL